jgi:NADH:ubiquinone oxidoreductase subunit E
MNLLKRSLKVNDIEDTTKDGLFTVMQVRCLGACGLAPIIKIDEEFYGKVNATSLPRILNKYRGEST